MPNSRLLSQYSRFWLIVAVVAILLLWVLRDVAAPFLTGLALAYFLNPLVGKLTSWRLPRWLAAGTILIGFLLLVSLLMAWAVPILAQQMQDFAQALPAYLERLKVNAAPYWAQAQGLLGEAEVARIQSALGDQAGTIFKAVQQFFVKILGGGLAVVGALSFLVITPIVAFYGMRDWPQLTQKIEQLWPRAQLPMIKQILAEFDARLAGFVRGQTMVCVTLGAIYATGLSVVGLNFALGIGFAAGLFSFVPYVGSISGFVASLIVGYIQFGGEWLPLAGVIAVFMVGQALEGYVLTPKLVGERVGLHALWVIFAIMAGGTLFGFTGMLLAVPVAALIGVLVRFGLASYQQSRFYHGQ